MLFSVITITKNNPDGFARTQRSVEAQDFKNFEWVVVDGDAEHDTGIYDAMNKGIERSRGDYLIFMNAGDAFAASDTLSRVAAYAGFDFLYGDALEDQHLKPARHGIAKGMPTHHQAMIYRRSDARFDTRYQIAADYKFTAQYMLGGTSRHLPFPVCIFESGGISQREAALGRFEQKLIRKELGLHAPFIGVQQFIAQLFKKTAPQFYWMLRSRLSTSRA